MKERIERINKYFNKIVDDYIPLTVEHLLHEIKKCDIPKEESGQIEGIHEELGKYFKDKENINYFKYLSKEPFCHLINLYPDNERWEKLSRIIGNRKTTPGKQTSQNKDPINLSISLDKKHLIKGAEIIFDFLSNENIEHMSSVANKVRTDDIIIKVFNQKDAEKVINFINTNSYINEGNLKPNPFQITSGIVGITQDNYNSYDVVVAAFIKHYLEDCKKRNKINTICAEEFYEFVKNYEINSIEFIKDARKTSNIDYSNDYKYISEIQRLIVLSLESNNLEKFYNHFRSVRGNPQEVIPAKERTVIETIMAAYDATKHKYNKHQAEAGLLAFLQNGNAASITRIMHTGEDIRKKIKEIGKDECKKAILEYTQEPDIVNAVAKFEEIRKYESIINELENAYNATYDKYGEEQARSGIELFIVHNFSRKIVRYDSENKEVRERIKLLNQELIAKALKHYCKKEKIEVKDNNYVTAIIEMFRQKKELNKESIKKH